MSKGMIFCEPIKGATEGAGSRFQRYLLCFLYAMDNGLNYMYKPDEQYLGHYTANALEISNAWNEIFEFLVGDNTEKNDSIIIQEISEISFSKTYKYLNSIGEERREALLHLARQKLFIHLKLKGLYKKNECYTISAHLRTLSIGDVLANTSSFPWQHFNVDYGLSNNNPIYYEKMYSKCINGIARRSGHDRVLLRIHSTTNPYTFESFTQLLDSNITVEFCTDMNAPDAFLDMLYSDVLIASHSSFSWLALLLRERQSFIRGGFRHFTTRHTTIIDEVLYDGMGPLRRSYNFLKLVLEYALFYPRYAFCVISSGAYTNNKGGKF